MTKFTKRTFYEKVCMLGRIESTYFDADSSLMSRGFVIKHCEINVKSIDSLLNILKPLRGPPSTERENVLLHFS